jgi:hypothetical protein
MIQRFQFFAISTARRIATLSPLVSTTEEKHDGRAALLIKHTVAWTVVDAQLAYATLGGLHIPRIAHRQPIYACLNTHAGLTILQPGKPAVERLRLHDREHGQDVSYGLQHVNSRLPLGDRSDPCEGTSTPWGYCVLTKHKLAFGPRRRLAGGRAGGHFHRRRSGSVRPLMEALRGPRS